VARPKEFDRDKALRSAIKVFADYGYAGTSTEALLSAMEISRQSLYDTFGSKHKLYIEALRCYTDQRAREFGENLNSGGSPISRIRKAVFSVLNRNDSLTEDGCLGVGSSIEFGTRSPDVVAARKEVAPRFLEPLMKMLARSRDRGEIRADVDLQLGSEFLLTLMNGLKVNLRAGAPTKRLKEIANLGLESFAPRSPREFVVESDSSEVVGRPSKDG
jgi:TetR/AcrR family transcriptional regulator, transcriptional repressor for nem operon